ncbi:MAG: helix-turn-helix transcriptional regulator [Imperialibacter sp.]|uniref:helix-turn-helix domain-containing protein n=1 Tax=Imperialibacter sp. TaxID=2038411 RepID=UPI0032EE3CAB
MLTFNLLQVLRVRWVRQPYAYLVRNGISPNLAHKMANEEIRAIRLDHIEKLCHLLNCTPNDLFRFTPGREVVPPGHALHQLARKDDEQQAVEWLTALHNLPLEELRKLAKEKKEKKEGE